MQGLARPAEDPASPSKPASGGGQGITITPSDVRKLFFKRKWILLAGAVIGLGLGIYVAETTVPEYEAVASVDLNLNRTSNIGISSLVSNGYANDWDSAQLDTQLRIMQSASVAKEVLRTPAEDLFR